MRKDFEKILYERARLGGIKSNEEVKNIEISDMSGRESTSRRRKKYYKSKNLNDAPFTRFLASRVGKNWDLVYSEIINTIKHVKTVDIHDLIDRKVEKNIIKNGDKIFNSKGEAFFAPFYVDPDTNTLCKSEAHYRKSDFRFKKEPKNILINNKYYRKINHIWYELELKPLPGFNGNENFISYKHPKGKELIYDVVAKTYITYKDCVNLHDKAVYASSKKQLNGNEIKHLNLNNIEV